MKEKHTILLIAFLKIMDLWDINEPADQLHILNIADLTADSVTTEAAMKILYIIRIYENLEIILGTNKSGRWVNAGNGAFDNKKVVDLIKTGDIEKIELIVKYLDYWAYNGW